MDDLKKWLRENDDAQNYYETNVDDLWEGIEAELGASRARPFYRRQWVRWAAAMLLIAVVGSLVLRNNASNQDGFALKDISPELADTEFFYSNQLTEKLETIKASGADIDEQMYVDLEELNSIYRDLMKDLSDGADNEEIIHMMIQNYRIRLEMLEQILNEIGSTENEKEDEISI